MKKLRIILNCKLFYFLLIFIVILNLYISIFIYKKESIYDVNDNSFECIIDYYFIEADKLKLNLICKEKLVGYYYFDSIGERESFIKNYNIGDLIKVSGNLEKFKTASSPNLFDYNDFQYINDVFYKINVESFYKTGKSNKMMYMIENFILDKIKPLKSFSYINALVLGNKDYIDSEVIDSYENNGIMHLFAISGMHISLLIAIFNKIFKQDNIYKFLFIIFIFAIYYFLVGSVSLLRAILFYVVTFFNKISDFKLNKLKCIILIISILLVVNPYYIYSVSFWYSVLIGSSLFIMSNRINSKNGYFKKLIYISSLSFLLSFPITIYNFFEVNIFSIVYNLVFVPLVSFILYPLCLATLIFSFLDNILFNFICIFESLSLFLNNFSLNFIFIKPSLLLVFIYYLFIYFSFRNKNLYFGLIIVILVHLNYNALFKPNYLIFIDVGQGDSVLVHLGNYNILVDTGGSFNYASSDWKEKDRYSIVENTTIPLLKSFGISKLDLLIISHGDYDHMGEAINLVNNFKVEEVIFNCGEFNELEQELIKVLNKKKLSYYSCIKELNIDDNKLYFLNNKNYGNENDNSSVIYTELNNHKFLFMGDAGVEVEEDLIEKYNLQDIDVLKVGHHGSKTSSSKLFIDEINPKYSIISVGKNNRYGHPNDSVLDNLEYSKIFRTDLDGSIVFKFKNGKLIVKTSVL